MGTPLLGPSCLGRESGLEENEKGLGDEPAAVPGCIVLTFRYLGSFLFFKFPAERRPAAH